MAVQRRLERLEGRAAVGHGSVAVGWEGDDGMIRYGERLLTRAEFMGLRADNHIVIVRRKDGQDE